MKIVRFLSAFLRVGLFILLLLLVWKNSDPVTLYFFLGNSVQVPLSLLLFGFLLLGAILGVLACLGTLFRRSGEIRALQRKLNAAGLGAAGSGTPGPGLRSGEGAATQPPPADAAG